MAVPFAPGHFGGQKVFSLFFSTLLSLQNNSRARLQGVKRGWKVGGLRIPPLLLTGASGAQHRQPAAQNTKRYRLRGPEPYQ
jgi:hypothetical protein